MLNTYIKAKVRAIKITDRKLEYEGSLTLDENIMDDLNVHPYEQVFVNGKYSKSRIMTYVLPGKRGSKCCELNGGAVHHFHNGEIVHLLFFGISSEPITPIVL